MKFNPFEDGKEYRPERQDNDEEELRYFEQEGRNDIAGMVDFYLNDTDGSAEFMDDVREVYKSETGKDITAEEVKEAFLEMVRDGILMVYFNIGFGYPGLLWKQEDGTWLEL